MHQSKRGLAPHTLHIIRNRNGFDHAPAQRRALRLAPFDNLDPRLDLANRPGLTDRNLVQGGDHITRPGLPDIIQADRIIGPIPAPALAKGSGRPCSLAHFITPT